MRILKLSIIAAAVIAAFVSLAAATASATILKGAGETTLGTGTTISAEAEGSLILHMPFGDLECREAQLSGKTANAGGEGLAVDVSIEELSFRNCGMEVIVLNKGTLAIVGTSGNNGTLRGGNTEVTIAVGGFHCIFRTSNTKLGTLTGSATTGSSATLDIEAVLPWVGGRSGAFCGSTSQWTGSYKFTAPSTLNIAGTGEGGEAKLSGRPLTGYVGETIASFWENNGNSSAVIDDEVVSSESVVEKAGSACGTIAALSSCTSRKVKCLKVGEATLTMRDTPSLEAQASIKCDPSLIGEASTGTVGDTLTVTWKNSSESTITIEDESNSNSLVLETTGSSCGTIAATGSCTSRKVKCLKAGEATLTARDTPLIEGNLVIKCDEKPALTGGPTTGKVGETVTVTWTNNTESALLVEDENTSDGTVAETTGSSCGEIAATSSCTKRKIKCLKAGESTITAVDTPSIEGKFVIKCS